MKFQICNRSGEDVLGGHVGHDNAYVACYSGDPDDSVVTLWRRHDVDKLDAKVCHPHQLEAGESTIRKYSLSGSSAHYVVRRIS